MEDRRELLAADGPTAPRVVFEQEGALPARSVEATVTDEVKDVEGVRLELLRERRQGRDVEPLDRDRIRVEQRLERAGQPRLLCVGVEELEVRGALTTPRIRMGSPTSSGRTGLGTSR